MGIIFSCIGNSQQRSVNSVWLFNTKSRVLQADWLILGNNEMLTLNSNMPYLEVQNLHYKYKIHI